SRRIIIEADISAAYEFEESLLAPRRLEIERERALVAIGVHEAETGRARLIAALRVLDLDHVRAEIREDEGRGRPGHNVAELEHARAVEWERSLRYGHRTIEA